MRCFCETKQRNVFISVWIACPPRNVEMHTFFARTHDAARHHTHARNSYSNATQRILSLCWNIVSSDRSAAYLAIDSNSQICRLSLNAPDCFALGDSAQNLQARESLSLEYTYIVQHQIIIMWRERETHFSFFFIYINLKEKPINRIF